MGQAGTGKGTQAQALAEHFGFTIFSTGDKSRETAALDTPLGHAIANIHTDGWIPEWLASYFLVKVLLEDCPNDGLVFESVARKPTEAEKLHEIHETVNRSYIVIWLEADESILRERLLSRNRPGYDVEEKIERRRQAFRDETMQSIQFFTDHGKLHKIDAGRAPEEVLADILALVEES